MNPARLADNPAEAPRHIAIWLFALCASGLFAIWPQIDLAVAGLFYTPAPDGMPSQLGFIGVRNGFLAALRHVLRLFPFFLLAGLIAAALAPAVWSDAPRLIGKRAVLFLAASLTLGPGLLVNGIFKEFSGRARPLQITEFGGEQRFSPAWTFSDQCAGNCSFSSGEAASAAWLLALVLVAPERLRKPVLIFAVLYIALVVLMRMAAGAHFLSDTLVSIILTQIVTLSVFTVLFTRPGRRAFL